MIAKVMIWIHIKMGTEVITGTREGLVKTTLISRRRTRLGSTGNYSVTHDGGEVMTEYSDDMRGIEPQQK